MILLSLSRQVCDVLISGSYCYPKSQFSRRILSITEAIHPAILRILLWLSPMWVIVTRINRFLSQFFLLCVSSFLDCRFGLLLYLVILGRYAKTTTAVESFFSEFCIYANWIPKIDLALNTYIHVNSMKGRKKNVLPAIRYNKGQSKWLLFF
jgi:hypothetical protein